MFTTPRLIEDWLEARAVTHVSVEVADVATAAPHTLPTDAGQDITHHPAAMVRLETWLDYASAPKLRTLLARLLEDMAWVAIHRVSAMPVAQVQRFHCRIELACFAPPDVLSSKVARRALASEHTPTELRDALGRTLFAALRAFTEELADVGGEMGELLSDYLAPKCFTSDEDKIQRFLANLSPPRRALIEDCRILSHLAHRHVDALEFLDDWQHRERIDESGTLRGLRLAFDPMFSPRPNPSATYPEELTQERASASVPRDPAQLAALIRQVDTPRYRKRSLLCLLGELPASTDTEGHILRLCAEPSVQFEALPILATLACARPLVEVLIFAEDPQRVAHALAELADFGGAFEDPMEAWHRSSRPPRRPLLRVDLGLMAQTALLDDLRSMSDELQARLATELSHELRPQAWLTSGLDLLQRANAPQTRDVARILSHHAQDQVRRWARMILDVEERAADRACAKHDEILEADVGAEGWENLYHKRIRLWRQPGYAWWRYQRDGHRSPLWDDSVERAHAAYDPQARTQDPELRRHCDAAIELGCRDAVVHYRRGVASFGENDPRDGLRWFEAAIPLFDERYRDNPYRAAAAETLAKWYRGKNHREQALRYFETALQSEPGAPASRQAVEQLTGELAALSAAEAAVARSGDGSIPALETGVLRELPSAVHPDRVTALEVSPQGEYALSADASGHVQVTRLSLGLAPRAIPIDGWQAHPEGPTSALWIDGSTIVTGGSDGRIQSACFAEDRLSARGLVAQVEGSITALGKTSDNRVAIASSTGSVSLWKPASNATVQLERRHGESVIVEFRRSDSWLLGRRADSELEVWRMAPTPTPHWRRPHVGYPLVIAEFISDEVMFLCNDQGHSWQVLVATGRASDIHLIPVDPPPIQIRFDRGGQLRVWGSANGCMQVEHATRGRIHTIVHNSLSRLAVCFATGMLVHVDATQRLGCHSFRADQD